MKNRSPRVSILVITYNQETLAREAVLSCIEQDYENLEVVVSDDGSSDRTVDMLSELRDQYPGRVKLLANPVNRGITRNCNIGLAQCDGELIAFMGGDDVLYRTKISTQVRAFQRNPNLVMCYHPCHLLTATGVTGVVGHRKKDLVRDVYDMIAKYGAEIPGPVAMVARRAIPERGFDEAIPVASDWMLYIDVCWKGEIERIDEILSAYRRHEGNVGRRVHTFADDFLKTVDLIKVRYPDRRAHDAADRGARRFLLGIMYRSILESELQLLTDYLAEYQRRGGRFGAVIKALARIDVAPAILSRLRGFLKRFL